MEIQIPTKDNKLSQPNDGDFAGNIWASWNMDFISNPGAIRVSPQTNIVMSNLDSTYMVYPVQFVEGNFLGAGDNNTTRIWAICDGSVFYTTTSNTPSGGFTKDATANSPTTTNHLYSDGVEWNGSLLVSSPNVLSKLTGGTWTASYKTFQDNTVPHPLGKGFNNLLLVGDYHATNGAVVSSIDTSDNISVSRVILGKDFNVIWIRSSSNMIYIGCRNKNGGRAKIFAWDGSSDNFNYDYKISGSECFAGIIHNEVPYTINERGELLALTGAAFTQIDNLPNFNTDYNLSGSWNPPLSVGRNAMTVQDNRIHILIQTAISTGNNQMLENELSGIWCYDKNIGLHHRYSITKDTGSNIIDYGSPTIVRSGSLFTLDKSNGNILIGASLYVNSGIAPNNTIRHCILTIKNLETDTSSKLGYFITPKISTQSVQENWQKAWLVIKKFLSANSKIVVKYRVFEKSFPFWQFGQGCIWNSTTSLSTSSSYFSELSAGDEIEILSGEGSGLSATISSLSGTNIINLDETVDGASDSLTAKASNWIKCGTNINIQEQEFFKIPLAQNSTWIQFKVIIFAEGKEEVKRLIIKSDPQLPVI